MFENSAPQVINARLWGNFASSEMPMSGIASIHWKGIYSESRLNTNDEISRSAQDEDSLTSKRLPGSLHRMDGNKQTLFTDKKDINMKTQYSAIYRAVIGAAMAALVSGSANAGRSVDEPRQPVSEQSESASGAFQNSVYSGRYSDSISHAGGKKGEAEFAVFEVDARSETTGKSVAQTWGGRRIDTLNLNQ
jgi:hypothetical protein